MGDLYEDVGTGYGNEDLYEECESFPEPPPGLPTSNGGHGSLHRMPMPLPKPTELSGPSQTNKPRPVSSQPVTTVIGDLQAKLEHQSGGIPFGVPLRSTNKPKDFVDAHAANDQAKRVSLPIGPTPRITTAKQQSGGPPPETKRLSMGPPSGGFRLPAASVVSSQRPTLRRVKPPTEVPKASTSPQPGTKPKPGAPPVKPSKPAVLAKPAPKDAAPRSLPGERFSPESPLPPKPDSPNVPCLSPSATNTAPSPTMPPKPSPCPPPSDYQRQPSIPQTPSLPSSPSTVASPTPNSQVSTGLVGRYRRLPLASVDPNSPPQIPYHTKPSLPPKGDTPNQSMPMPIEKDSSLQRRKSFKVPPPSSSPPTSVPPPPPLDEPDDMYDDVERLAEEVNERLTNNEDLQDDIDMIEQTMEMSQPPPPIGKPPAPDGVPPPPSPDDIPDEIGECLYDDVEEVSAQVRKNLASMPPPPEEEDQYEVTGPDDDGLPPPSDELYDEVIAAGGDMGVAEEDEFDRGTSDSDHLAVESEEWSNDDPDSGEFNNQQASVPLPQLGEMPAPVQEPKSNKKKKGKEAKKEIKMKKEEERRRKEEDRLATKRREKEEKEQQKQREKEEKERQKLIVKQRKHFKVGTDEKKIGVVIAKSTCKGGPEHYLLYRAGEKFSVILKESDKKRKLPPNAWLVERQEDHQVGLIEVINVTEEQKDDFGYGDESLYEDVGQGAQVTRGHPATQGVIPTSSYSLSTGVAHSHPSPNIPPPSMRAPPPPGVPFPQEDALYEDLPCNQ